MEKSNDLTIEQWALAQYLEDMFNEDEKAIVTKEMICSNFPETYRRAQETTCEHNSGAYAKIRRQINAIKFSKAWTYTLITIPGIGYKIATEDEAKNYLKSELIRGKKILKKCAILKSKIKDDGQAYFTDDDLKFIDTFKRGQSNETRNV